MNNVIQNLLVFSLEFISIEFISSKCYIIGL